ncbi:MAG: hypothetical protein BAA01_01900 [Bacillus thermozeamaize]|uniref:Arginase n=1 Tax=Bacillus thermozeamaize TaxID=230954 RepID=A0A1Y3PIY7_9BACI|nr:MAG: hypothetical protein BAA01_01900 [Bacillus thermozeamaize]
MCSGVTVLDFDHSYHQQAHLQNPAYEWLDLSDIPGTKRYCAAESLSVIRQRLRKRKKRGVTLIGSGNYHYVTYLLLSEMKMPFSLVLFDHHTDMMEPLGATVVSCGSWVLKAVEELPLLKKVVIIGARHGTKWKIPFHLKRKISILENVPPGTAETLVRSIVSLLPTNVVYISIDKDVLDRTEVVTDWEQGTMKLQVLIGLLRGIAKYREICGIDICGEYPVSPVAMFRPEYRGAVRKNARANQVLLDTIHTLKIKD